MCVSFNLMKLCYISLDVPLQLSIASLGDHNTQNIPLKAMLVIKISHKYTTIEKIKKIAILFKRAVKNVEVFLATNF